MQDSSQCCHLSQAVHGIRYSQIFASTVCWPRDFRRAGCIGHCGDFNRGRRGDNFSKTLSWGLDDESKIRAGQRVVQDAEMVQTLHARAQLFVQPDWNERAFRTRRTTGLTSKPEKFVTASPRFSAIQRTLLTHSALFNREGTQEWRAAEEKERDQGMRTVGNQR